MFETIFAGVLTPDDGSDIDRPEAIDVLVSVIAHLLEEDTMQPASTIDFKVAAIAQKAVRASAPLKSRPIPKSFSSPGLTGVNMTDIIPGMTFGAWSVLEDRGTRRLGALSVPQHPWSPSRH